ncbi:hypothetical protein [Brevundimonas halotolerans]|uniref:O-antigen ligase family protein n=1 Tax=Brevundimonas halotolerans TaxID=69670 RepID=A0A7W9A547_9CAUL|nr:hypothetical protein [Brevundimonas halotolerans]MBB5661412.1 hypothetical protein [Brevundimonas halotolerans]
MTLQAGAQKLLRLAAAGGFLLLYPLFFVYHFVVGSGFIPPFVFGLYGPATIFIAAIGGLPLALLIRRHTGHPMIAAAAFLLFYCTAWVMLFGYAIPDTPYLDQVNFQSLSIILGWGALYIVGLFFPWQSRTLKLASVGLFAVIGAIIVANTSWSGLTLTIPGQETGDVASYQGFARSVFVLSFALLAWSRTRSEQIGIWLISSLLLFLISARSEFAAYIATTLIVAFVIQKAHPARTALLVFGVVVVWVLTSGLGTSIAESLGQSRHVGLLDLSADTSWNARQEMQAYAIDQIAGSPIVGDYGGHIYFDDMQLGSEAHNALSAWVTFGLVGFCLYVGLTAAALWLSIRFFLVQPMRPDVRFACCMALSVTILIISSKSVYWAEPALAWGMVTRLVIRSTWGPKAVGLGPARNLLRLKRVGQTERHLR